MGANTLNYIATDVSKTKETDSTIDVVLVLRDQSGTYARHAAVVMASLFANTLRDVCVYIIHDDTLVPENIEKLRQTADSYRQRLQFINAEKALSEKQLKTGKLAPDGNRGKLLKLLIPELIDVSKVIYLDCDIVVKLDLSELWAVDIGDKSIGAANEVWSLERCWDKKYPWRWGLMLKAMGIDRSAYFNSGVLVMDLDKIRTRYDFISEASDFYRKYGKIATFADQDCLNYIFARDTCIIDEKFNRIDFSDITEQERRAFACVWHMTGEKPWESYTRPGVDDLYWHYLAQTPWGADLVGLLCDGLKGLQSSEFYHRHSSSCVKKLKKQIRGNILKAFKWREPYLFFAIIKRHLQG